jgi:preprotein translocase subunit SecA
LHAHVLFRRDVDYIVKEGAIQIVDEFKGRVAENRRWPASLHAAVEIKEGVAEKSQGRILGQTTMQQMIGMCPEVCGMTGTAVTQKGEFSSIYGLTVEVIPPHRPVQRVDHPDLFFRTRAAKEDAVLEEIRRAHAKGQPVLIGTGSVAESEQLSRRLADIPHNVLNARDDAAEASIVANAGQHGAVTISTNMAGRGTDIRLGPGAAEAGGLYVIGMQRHESRRIDNQLRGRSGRQGDPGCSQFFLSDEDDLLIKYRDLHPHLRKATAGDVDTLQRLIEGQHLDARLYLQNYDTPMEGQRHQIHTQRQQVLENETLSEQTRFVTLRTIDDLWADHLERIAEFKEGLPWLDWALVSTLGYGHRNPYQEYIQAIHGWFKALQQKLPEEIERRLAHAQEFGVVDSGERGAVWTYLTTDQPFGTWTERFIRGLRKRNR